MEHIELTLERMYRQGAGLIVVNLDITGKKFRVSPQVKYTHHPIYTYQRRSVPQNNLNSPTRVLRYILAHSRSQT
jgi:hypothetical protein